jgi:hypothetical protein
MVERTVVTIRQTSTAGISSSWHCGSVSMLDLNWPACCSAIEPREEENIKSQSEVIMIELLNGSDQLGVPFWRTKLMTLKMHHGDIPHAGDRCNPLFLECP